LTLQTHGWLCGGTNIVAVGVLCVSKRGPGRRRKPPKAGGDGNQRPPGAPARPQKRRPATASNSQLRSDTARVISEMTYVYPIAVMQIISRADPGPCVRNGALRRGGALYFSPIAPLSSVFSFFFLPYFYFRGAGLVFCLSPLSSAPAPVRMFLNSLPALLRGVLWSWRAA
jgi:hypothetical protein